MSETIINIFLVMSGVVITVIAIALLILLVIAIKIFKDIKGIIHSAKEGSEVALQEIHALKSSFKKKKIPFFSIITSTMKAFTKNKDKE
jgi:hypothetical protein